MPERRALVVGGRGFIGRHVSRCLSARGVSVRCFDLPESRLVSVPPADPRVEQLTGDLLDEASLNLAVEGCHECYHLASLTVPSNSNEDPMFDVRANLIGTLRLLEACVRFGVRRVVFASSGGTVYGAAKTLVDESHPTDPTCSYGIVKLAVEKYLALYRQIHGLDGIVLRIANPYGPGQGLAGSQGAVGVFMRRVMRSEPIQIWGDGSFVRDYVYVGDVAEAFALAGEYEGPHRIFNVGSGIGRSLVEVLREVEKVTGIAAKVDFVPSRGFDVPFNVLDVRRAASHLPWSPRVDFRAGLSEAHRWMRNEIFAG